jgi:aldehyde dehydrogenase (NAD+)
MLTDALEMGSEIECGGVVNKADNYFAPTVLSNVPQTAIVMNEEIFGPILPVITYHDISEVIELINSKPKPLALYIFSGSSEFQYKVLQETSSGSVAINDCVIQFMNPHLPFGGINHSGFGKSHGHSGFLAFSNQKSVLKQKIGLTSVKPLFPPYTKLTRKAIDFLLKYL